MLIKSRKKILGRQHLTSTGNLFCCDARWFPLKVFIISTLMSSKCQGASACRQGAHRPRSHCGDQDSLCCCTVGGLVSWATMLCRKRQVERVDNVTSGARLAFARNCSRPRRAVRLVSSAGSLFGSFATTSRPKTQVVLKRPSVTVLLLVPAVWNRFPLERSGINSVFLVAVWMLTFKFELWCHLCKECDRIITCTFPFRLRAWRKVAKTVSALNVVCSSDGRHFAVWTWLGSCFLVRRLHDCLLAVVYNFNPVFSHSFVGSNKTGLAIIYSGVHANFLMFFFEACLQDFFCFSRSHAGIDPPLFPAQDRVSRWPWDCCDPWACKNTCGGFTILLVKLHIPKESLEQFCGGMRRLCRYFSTANLQGESECKLKKK